MPKVVRLLLLALLGAAVVPTTAGATSPDRVLIIANAQHPWSGAVASAYRRARGVPDAHILSLQVAPEAQVAREVYQRSIEVPIARWLRERQAFDQIDVIVLAPGLPLRITGSGGRAGSTASVDSELTLLYRRLTGAVVPAAGFVENPYFTASALGTPRPFRRDLHDIFLVTRLDGRSQAEAESLIERGGRYASAFVVVTDGRPPEMSGAEARWLADVAPRVREAKPDARVVSDETAEVITGVTGVTGYAGWGSNDVPGAVPPVTFGPAAVASSFMSSDARTLEAPPSGWRPGPWRAGADFAGSPEALAADWLAAGLTGLGSQVTEPYLDGAFRPATLHEAWARGYTLAESFYLALPYLSWQGVVFGDPLARATDAPLERPTTEASVFVDRSAAVLRIRQPALDVDASRLMVLANLSIGRGEVEEATRLLEQVTVRAPKYLAGHLALGQQYDQAGQHALATERYRLALELEPANVIALNNLAYSVGVRQGQPAAALPIAERAGRLGSNSAAVLDTLGWIRHLAGDSQGALAPLRQAVAVAPGLCEAWAHLATVERVAGTAADADVAERRAASCQAQ